MTDCSAGPAPVNGTCTMSKPSDWRNSSPDKCGVVPTPGEAKLCFPGFFLTISTSSLMLWAGPCGLTTTTFGDAPEMVTGTRSLVGSYGTLACRLGLTT